MTASQLVEILKSFGVNINIETANSLLSLFDFEDYVQDELSQLDVQIWDKQSPINGVSASAFLSRPDVKNADIIYLVLKNGQVIYFQPHSPFSAGFVPITAENFDEVTQRHLRQIAEQYATSRFINDIINYLNSNGN